MLGLLGTSWLEIAYGRAGGTDGKRATSFKRNGVAAQLIASVETRFIASDSGAINCAATPSALIHSVVPINL